MDAEDVKKKLKIGQLYAALWSINSKGYIK